MAQSMDKMEDCAEDTLRKEKPGEEAGGAEQEGDERGRPSTPKWWRPPIPPETYQWEEIRRQRQKGGYPWTHLDKDEEIDADDYLDDNLYEPVNPPPLYGNDGYLSKELQQVPQSENRMIDIPPEIEILTSEGLDGLDKPDSIDKGFDGDREWQNASEDEGGRQSRSSFKAGIRAPGESRSTTPKSVGFSPETITHVTPADEEMEEQEVPGDDDAEPSSSRGSRGRRSRSNSPGRKQTAFDILKSKVADKADQVKQRIRSAIPVRPKMTKSRKRRKLKHEQAESGEQEVPEDAEMKEGEEGGEQQEEKPTEETSEEKAEAVEEPAEAAEGESTDELKSAKQLEKEEKERKKTEEKLAKQKAAEDAKQAKLEEKLAKAREAEEKRQAKAEEEKRKQEEKEEAARKAAEEKKAEDERKAAEKAAKEEAARVAAEAKKAEEEAKKAAEKARKEEEARKKAEAKKAEEERKAAEKAKKEEEARKAAEAKKAEDERKAAEKAAEEARKAAEKAAKEEEARKAAEAKKAAEEEARKEAEAKRAAEDAAKASQPEDEGVKPEASEEAQQMDTTEEKAGDDQGEGGQEEESEVPQTPSGTTKRKYIVHRRQPIKLSEIPNPITTLRNQVEDFKNKIRRSRTPPRRPIQRKGRRSRSADASKSPPRDPDEVSQKTEEGEEHAQESEAKTDEAVEKSEDAVQQSAPEEGETSKPPSEAAGPASNTGTARRRKYHPAKDKIDKIGASIKEVGVKSLDIATLPLKAVGNTLTAVGKLGAKVIVEVSQGISESKQKAEPHEAPQPTTEERAPEPAPPPPAPEPVEPPKRTFRFKRRGESQEEEDDQEHFYENAQEANQGNALLGSGARDWESPQDRAHSRGESEERYSGKISSRDSPPGSSLASSTIAQVRRTGVLEEIDSDEFFLRERGISEGEDEEEVNRFLVEELRQAFRPSLSNALAGFDMEPPLAAPPRPERAPRKPPRKDKDSANPPTYQTFPPERPKRKGPQGYVSKFMEEQEDEEGEYLGSNEEVRGSSTGDMEEEMEESDAMQAMKDKLSELDREFGDTEATVESPEETTTVQPYEDDGRYEPINEGPTKPTRTKRKQPKRPPTPPSFYYNTIAATEWLRGLEQHSQGNEPAPPVRKRRGSGKSSSIAPSEEGNRDEQHLGLPTYSEPSQSATASVQESGNEDNADYVDEAGYAIVQKDRDLPKTIPRKKKKRTNLSGQTGAGQGDPSAAFFSLPRGSPPTRPNRTYSTLRPRRPPRSKSGSRQNLDHDKSPVPTRREGDEPRPSTAIGIMQGRPLPPPPRPQRSPAPPLNDLDQSSIEMAVGLRHYANFEDIEPRTLEETSPPRIIEVDMACQTDPVPEDEFVLGLTEQITMEDSGIVRTASLRLGAPPVQQAESQQRASSTTTAEKIVDKELNLPGVSQADDNYSIAERQDVSVGPNIPSTTALPQQLNNLNQTSTPETISQTEFRQPEPAPLESFNEPQVIEHTSPPHSSPISQQEQRKPEVKEEHEDENVVVGSYTLPYSSPYPPISPQSPPATPSSSSLSRTSSLKKSQRSSESAPKTPPPPRRRGDDAHIAFGHTSVAQGEVLSVKLSIPVERAIGQTQNNSTSELRTPPRSRGGSNPRQLPESTNAQADSSRRDAQKKVEAQRKPISSAATTATPPAPPTAAQVPPTTPVLPPPPQPPANLQGESEEGFLETSVRLGRAVFRFAMRALQAMADYIDTAASEDPSKAEQQRANMQVLLCLLLFLLVGLILATTRSGPYSSPRWEFLMPPPDL